MRSSQFITELMDKPVPFRVSRGHGEYIAKFQVGTSQIEVALLTDQLLYGGINNGPDINVVQIEFDDNDPGTASYRLTNKGNSIAIFSTIIEILKGFDTKERPTFYLYETDKGSDKSRLYGKLARKFFNDLGIVQISGAKLHAYAVSQGLGELAFDANNAAIFTVPKRYKAQYRKMKLPPLDEIT